MTFFIISSTSQLISLISLNKTNKSPQCHSLRMDEGFLKDRALTLLRLHMGLFVANLSATEGKEAVGWQDISPGQWTDVKALHRFPSILVCISPTHRGQRAQVLSPCCLFQQLAFFYRTEASLYRAYFVLPVFSEIGNHNFLKCRLLFCANARSQ